MQKHRSNRKRWRASVTVIQRARELRQQMTPAERVLWARSRDHQLDDLHIRRQHPLGRFITDFYYAPTRLIIEIDGGIHTLQADCDRTRAEWLQANGGRAIRFTNEQVMQNLEQVLEDIRRACRSAPARKTGEQPDSPFSRFAGEGPGMGAS